MCRLQGQKEGVEAFKDGFMKTNISSYSNYENYFQLHERNDFRGFCKLNAIPIKKLEKQRHKLSNGSAHNTSIKRQKLGITNFLNCVRMLNRTTITDIKDNGSHFL